jgi:hypothetical protein
MSLSNLTDTEKAVVYECLSCVAGGRVILHDQEFSTLFGLSVGEFLTIYNTWPNVDDSKEDVALAINNAMNTLLGYPHDYHERWHEALATPPVEVRRVFMKWRGEKRAKTQVRRAARRLKK